ncbi:MAG: hypothetical protein LQ349_008563 [Xanthoria aureola]|nr:MAG: hypothetical protein LQ349_008563 [Xanthoria aureola]
MQAAHQRKVVPKGDSWWTKTPVESSGITAAPRVPPKCSSEKQIAKRASSCEHEAPMMKKRYRPIPRKRKERTRDHSAHFRPPQLLDEALDTSKIENPARVISGSTTDAIPRRPSGIQQSILSRLPLELRQHVYGLVLGGDREFEVAISYRDPLADKMGLPPRAHFCILETRRTRLDLLKKNVCPKERRARFHRVALLQTCRQIHTEAIDLLYQGTTFIFKKPEVIKHLAAKLGPCNFDNIRHVDVRFWEIAHEDPSLGCDSDMVSHWNFFWSTMIGITHLRTLHVDMKYEVKMWYHSADQQYSRPLLEPLLALSGLREFKFNFTIHDSLFIVTINLPLSTQTLALIEKIHEAATRPRIEPKCFPEEEVGRIW